MAWSMYNPNRSNRWQDWLNLILAIWLFFSPWILQFSGGAWTTAQPPAGNAAAQAVVNADWNAWVLGAIVFLVSLSAIGRMELWQEVVNLILGAWIFIAPWVLGFTTGPQPAASAASWDHWIVGALIFLISASSLSQLGPTQRQQVSPFNGRQRSPR